MRKEKFLSFFSLKKLYYTTPFFIVLIGVFSSYLAPEDLGYYIRMGEVMIENGAVLSQDIFTHTLSGMEYINHGWLSQVVLAVFHSAGGKEILILLNAFILLLSLYIFIKLLLRVNINYKVCFLFSFMYILTGLTNWNLRPQLFVLPIFIYYFSFLYAGQKIKKSQVGIFFLLMVLWANLHNSFPAGIGLIGIFLVSKSIKIYLNKKTLTKIIFDKKIQSLFILLAAVSLATLLNPYGIRIWESVFNTMDKASYRSAEWLPLTINTPTGLIFYISLLAGFGTVLKSNTKIKIEEIILFLFFTYQSLLHLRMVIWWGIIFSAVFARHFQSIIDSLTSDSKLYFLKAGEDKGNSYINGIILLCMLGSVIIFSPYFRKKLPGSRMKYFIDPRQQPVEVADYMEKHTLPGNIFNYSDWGSYIIWRLWPDYSPFFGTRMHIVPKDIWSDYWIVYEGKAGWEEVLDKYDVKTVILNRNKNEYIIEILRDAKNWEKILSGRAGILFKRKN
ncbi:MAG: hypothetical protein ACQEQC_00400 [Elusimicrobiota bacterium]